MKKKENYYRHEILPNMNDEIIPVLIILEVDQLTVQKSISIE